MYYVQSLRTTAQNIILLLCSLQYNPATSIDSWARHNERLSSPQYTSICTCFLRFCTIHICTAVCSCFRRFGSDHQRSPPCTNTLSRPSDYCKYICHHSCIHRRNRLFQLLARRDSVSCRRMYHYNLACTRICTRFRK